MVILESSFHTGVAQSLSQGAGGRIPFYPSNIGKISPILDQPNLSFLTGPGTEGDLGNAVSLLIPGIPIMMRSRVRRLVITRKATRKQSCMV